MFFIFLLGGCLVAGLGVAGLLCIETQPVQAFIQRQINTAIPGTLSWEQFRLDLKKGRVQMSGIRLKGVSGKEVAAIARVAARVDWSAFSWNKIELIQVLIDDPVLDIGMSGHGAIDLVSALVGDESSPWDVDASKPPSSPDIDLRIREFKVNKAHIKVTAPHFNADLPGVSVAVKGFQPAGRCASAAISLAGGHLKFGDMDLALDAFDGRARMDKDNISDIWVNARIPGIAFNATGSVAGLLGTVTPDVTATLDVDAPLAATVLGLPRDSVQGKGRFDLTMNGGIDNPRARVRFAFGPGSINNMFISGITGSAGLENRHLTFTDCRVDLPAGTIPFSGDVDLSKTFPKGFSSPMAGLDTLAYHFSVHSDNLSLDALELGEPAPKGWVSARIRGQGRGVMPGQMAVHADLEFSAHDLILPWMSRSGKMQFQADSLVCKARMDKKMLQIQDLTLKRNQGSLNASGTLSLGGKKEEPHALDLSVAINRLELDEIAPDLGVRGRFSGNVTGTGSLEHPDITAVVSGQNPGGGALSLDSIQSQLRFVNAVLTLEQARIQKKNAHLDITGQINVADKTIDIRAVIPETDLGDMDLAAGTLLDAGRLGMDVSVQGDLPAPDISGRINAWDLRLPNAPDMAVGLNAAIEAHGPLDTPEALQAAVHITRLALAKQGQMLIHINNARVLLKDGRFSLDPVPVRIMDKGALTLSANGDIKGDLTADAVGSLPGAMLLPLSDGITFADGEIQIALHARGKTLSPDFRGSIDFANIILDLETLDAPLRKINGRITLTPGAIEIRDVTAGLGNGKLRLTGKAELKNGIPQTFQLNFDAGQVPVNIPDTMDITLNSQLTWAGTMDKSAITGQIEIFDGIYYKDVDLNLIRIAAQATRESRPEIREPKPAFLKTIGLDIYVTRRQAIGVDNNLLSMHISPNLSVRGSAYAPSLDGRAVVDEGTMRFQKAEFEITKGAIDFINPYKIEPEISLTCETTISSHTITLSVTGTPDDLNLEFSSDPYETDADILSLIAFGKTTDEMGAGNSDGDSISAAAIAGILADPLSEKIMEATGLSQVDIHMDEGEDSDSGVQVRLGADLSRQLSISYGMDIHDGETVQTVTTYYKLLEHLILSSFQSTSGKFGGELKYRLEFR